MGLFPSPLSWDIKYLLTTLCFRQTDTHKHTHMHTPTRPPPHTHTTLYNIVCNFAEEETYMQTDGQTNIGTLNIESAVIRQI